MSRTTVLRESIGSQTHLSTTSTF